MAELHPTNEFSEVVALLVGAADEDADLSMVEIGRSDVGRVVTFRTETPQAFLGRGRTRASELRNALAERLGDPELRLQVIRPGSDEVTG